MRLEQWYVELVARYGIDQDRWLLECDQCGFLHTGAGLVNFDLLFGKICPVCHSTAGPIETPDGPRFKWFEACDTCFGDTVVCEHGNRLAECTEPDCEGEPHQCPECRQ